MFLTVVSMLRAAKIYPQSRWYKHQKLKEQAKHFWLEALRNRTGKVKELLRRALVNQAFARKNKYVIGNRLKFERLAAACSEHNINTKEFRLGLTRCKINLNTTMLINLAIYEPRTFERMVELSERARIEAYYEMHQKLPERCLSSGTQTKKLTTALY